MDTTLERRIVEQCAPTLAGLKCGSMFKCCPEEGFASDISRIDRVLGPKGVRIVVLRSSECGTLVYVYREKILSERISDDQICSFLKERGYDCENVVSVIDSLKKTVSRTDYIPHEIGLFLGYPLDDVVGFIENKGRNYKCMGCWKVYGDAKVSVRNFERYRKCRSDCTERFLSGATIDGLTVMQCPEVN